MICPKAFNCNIDINARPRSHCYIHKENLGTTNNSCSAGCPTMKTAMSIVPGSSCISLYDSAIEIQKNNKNMSIEEINAKIIILILKDEKD